MAEQSLQNHAHRPTHTGVAGLFAMGALVLQVMRMRGTDTGGWEIVFVILAVFTLTLISRTYTVRLQDRIIMLTDKALYNVDVNGYMVNRRVELPQIQQILASPFCDDFLCVKCEDGHDFFFESPKKSELVHLLLE